MLSFVFMLMTGAIVVQPIIIDATAANITWTSEPMDTDITNFTVWVTYTGPCTASNVPQFSINVDSETRTYPITSLEEFRTYNITVAAISGDSVISSNSTTINTTMSCKSSQ